MLWPCHASLRQKGGVQPAGGTMARVQRLAACPVSQEGPKAAALGSRHSKGPDDLFRFQSQKFSPGGGAAKDTAGSGSVPAFLPVGRHSQGHTDAGRHLIAANHSRQKFLAAAVKAFRQCPGGRDDAGAAVGLGGRVDIVQLQGMGQHGVDLGGYFHRKFLTPAPHRSRPSPIAAPVGGDYRLH